MLHHETLDARTLDLLRRIQGQPLFAETRLVGGTALALQLGHRKSVDLDFFGSMIASSEEIRFSLKATGELKVVQETKNIHIYQVNGIKVDVVHYDYPWLKEAAQVDGCRLASVEDIAAMKIAAIVGRGTRKDFVDLFFLLQVYSLHDILDLYLKKYNDASLFFALKSLAYFEDAETDPMPVMLKPVSWTKIKDTVLQQLQATELQI